MPSTSYRMSRMVIFSWRLAPMTGAPTDELVAFSKVERDPSRFLTTTDVVKATTRNVCVWQHDDLVCIFYTRLKSRQLVTGFLSSALHHHHHQRRQSNFACSPRSSHATLSSVLQSLLLTATPHSSILDIERRRLPRASMCASPGAREIKLARTHRRLNPGCAPLVRARVVRLSFSCLFHAIRARRRAAVASKARTYILRSQK